MVSEKKSELIIETILKMVFLKFCIFGVFQNVQKDKGRRDKIRKILIRGKIRNFRTLP